MDIKFKKGFSITLIIAFVLLLVFGYILVLTYIENFHQDTEYELSISEGFIFAFYLTLQNLSRIVIGVWLFIIAGKYSQEKWSWSMLGLAYGQYSLLLFVILLFIQNRKDFKIDLIKSVRPVLVLLIIAIILNPILTTLAKPYSVRLVEASAYFYLTTYMSYLSLFKYGVVIFVNIVIATKLYSFINQLKIKGKLLWIVSTVILGLFPVILFNELVLIEKNNVA